MRLLQTTGTDPELVYFVGEIPRYAILSHVWGDEEVTFQDMQDPLKRKEMKGWSKLVGACEQARSEDWEYIWIDTCCIDKSSSAELSEAINSMYRYYKKAEICYAYLTDIQSNRLGRSFDLNFRTCRWFTRGWTLQELIAPVTVFFFTNDWVKIGTKASLQEMITEVTGIPSSVLLSQDGPSECSIAARMSWAAGRKTTRVEDRAYSLMGLFDVYMPPIYGEGEHAFIRLQEEIMKVSDDHTIFAWKSKLRSIFVTGILATSPDVFEESGIYVYNPLSSNPRPFSMTNKGLLVHLPLLPILPVVNDKPQFLALLDCRPKSTLWVNHPSLAIYVSRFKEGQYQRVQSDELLDEDAIRAKCGTLKGSPQELLFKAWDLPHPERNFYSDQITVFYSQGIRLIRVKPSNADSSDTDSSDADSSDADSSNADLHVAAKITDPADHSMGVYTTDDDPYSSLRVFLFIHDPTSRPFVVVAGMGWLDLLLDFTTDKPDLEDIQLSYYGEREDISRKNLDMVSKFLTDNVAVLVEARRQYQSDDAYYVFNVRIIDKSYAHVAPAVLPVRTSYSFSVSFPSAINAGFSLLDTYPDNAWEECNDVTMNLFLNDASITGTLCFQHEQNQKRFAVTFGFRGKTVWSDIHFLLDTEYKETAKDICNLDYNDQKRDGDNSVLFASDKVILSPQNPSPAGSPPGNGVLSASLYSRVLRNSPNQYESEIGVSDH